MWSTWNTGQAKTRKARPETVWEFLLQVSHRFFYKVCKPLWASVLGGERDYGVGMFFLPQDELKRNQARKIFSRVIVKKEGMKFLGWREVPIHTVRSSERRRWRLHAVYYAGHLSKRPEKVEKGLDFDRKLYVARRDL